MKQNWVIPLVAALVFVADALSKQWALANLHDGAVMPVIPNIIQFVLTSNTGAAFGIGRQHKSLMTILPMIICAAIIFWIVKRTKAGHGLERWEQIGYGMVLGGAMGNIAERLYRGQVTDFLDFAFMEFPIFNVADSLIDVGVGIIILHSIFSKPAAEAPVVAASAPGSNSSASEADSKPPDEIS